VIRMPATALRHIEDAACAAYPHECCGLLAGTRDADGGVTVSRAVTSRNLAETDTLDSFEVDPQVRFDLMRALEAAGGGEEIVGHYHSHPDHPAVPSARDLAMAYEPDLIWVIAASRPDGIAEVRAHALDAAGTRFSEIPLQITDADTYGSATTFDDGDFDT
jgi:proteasome lid subunit RPN8/RPN11